VDDRDLDYVLPSVDGVQVSKTTTSTQRTTNLWREEGPWLVVVLLAVVLPAFRRGWLGVLLAFILLPQISQAFSWENVWERSDQQAMKALEQEDPKKAANLFEQPDWKGIAHYRAGDFEQAEQVFSEMESRDAHYNRGNALAKLGKYPEAMASYQAALTQESDHGDAQHNLEVLKKLLEDHQSQPSQGSESQSSDRSSEDNKQPGEQGSQNQQSQEQASEKSGQDETPGQSASKQDGNENEQGSAGSTQDSLDNAKQSEEPESQNPSQDPQENTDPSDIAKTSPGENGKDADPKERLASASPSESVRDDQKSEQALQQWLRRIPDDPGGLLRRKFLLEHRRRMESGTAVDSSGRPW
jgi:Ca-activated chloride channel family protein